MTRLKSACMGRVFRSEAGMRVARTVAAACVAVLGIQVPALAASGPGVVISGAWVRATAPGQPVAAAYMDITSQQDATLERLEADAAGEVQVHSMSMEGEVMRMRQLPQLSLPAARKVRLAPSGTHLMLLTLRRPLRPGETVRFTLTVLGAEGRRQVVQATAPVRAEAPEPPR